MNKEETTGYEEFQEESIKELINSVKEIADKLGFNAKWDMQRRKYIFLERIFSFGLFAVVSLIIGVFLMILVDNGRIDGTTFSTLIAVLLGAILDRSIKSTKSSL